MQSSAQIETFLAALLFAIIFLFGWRLHRARTSRAMLSLGATCESDASFWPWRLAGWSVAMISEIPRMAIITSLAVVSGGVVMNSMVMELPSEKDGRFWPFDSGAAAYTALLLLIR
jgi:hypothetical protein